MGEGTVGSDEMYWSAFTAATPDSMLVVDATGTILSTNRPMQVRGAPIVGRKVWEFSTEGAEGRLREKIGEVTSSKKAVVYEAEGLRLDGQAAWFEVRIVPVIQDEVVDRLVWVATDISVRKKLEDQLRQAHKMEAIGLFAGGVAHDFTNVLSVILATTEFAARSVSSDHRLSALLAEIADAAKRGGELTRRLLAFSRTQNLYPRAIDLGGVVEDFGRMIGRVFGDDVELVVRRPDATVTVHADPVQLEQVLMNLCTNARQAMPSGGTLTLAARPVDVDASFVDANSKRTALAGLRAGAFAEVSVCDTGAGMDSATMARAFDPFFTTKIDGTGLGLPTVHGIAHQHGGFVLVDSAPGEGSTFRVFLPRTATA